jgi:hypothetical protein
MQLVSTTRLQMQARCLNRAAFPLPKLRLIKSLESSVEEEERFP